MSFADDVRKIGHEADTTRRRRVLGYLLIGVLDAFAAGYVSLLSDLEPRAVLVFIFALLAILQGAWAGMRATR